MSVRKIFITIMLIATLLTGGCVQSKENATTELTTQNTTKIATTELEITTEVTTTEEVTTVSTPEKGSKENPYQMGDTATIEAMDYWTSEKIVLSIRVDGWEGRDLIGEIGIEETSINDLISVDEDAIYAYLHKDNYIMLTDDFVAISSVPNGEFASTDLKLPGVSSSNVYYSPWSDVSHEALKEAKYIVFYYYKYNDSQIFSPRPDSCWFEIPTYGE